MVPDATENIVLIRLSAKKAAALGWDTTIVQFIVTFMHIPGAITIACRTETHGILCIPSMVTALMIQRPLFSKIWEVANV